MSIEYERIELPMEYFKRLEKIASKNRISPDTLLEKLVSFSLVKLEKGENPNFLGVKIEEILNS